MPDAAPPRTRVGLVDDHAGVREGFALLLERAGYTVCCSVAGADAALEAAAAAQLDVIVVDLHLGEDDGLRLIGRLLERCPDLAVVVYSMYRDGVRIRRALAAGAHAYVTKQESAGVLAAAVAEVAAGRTFLSPLVRRLLSRAPVADGHRATLSDQEYRVFAALGEGWTTAEIAHRLGISGRTVETYYRRMQVKLEVSGVPELRRLAIEQLRS